MASVALHTSTSAFSQLLARYMKGQITDSTWSSLMRLLDTASVSSAERMALARFVTDLVDERGVTALRMPRIGEVEDLLDDTRH